MSRHHRHVEVSKDAPHPATIMNGKHGVDAEDKDSEDEKCATASQSQSQSDSSSDSQSDSSSDGASSASSDSSKSSDTGTATARWRRVAQKAAQKLTTLFEEAKAKGQEVASDASKKIAGAAEENFDEAFEAIRAHAKEMMEKGKSTRVRIKLRERTLTEVPLAAMAAAEAASLWWFGPIRMMLGHIVGRAVLDLELVSEADPHVSEARKFFLDGEIDQAMSAIDKAIAADHTCATAHMLRGTLLKIRGDKEGAKSEFMRAEECDAKGEVGMRAHKAGEALH